MKYRIVIAAPLLIMSGVQAHAETITVKPGDSLSRLARLHLGSADAWPLICKANNAVLRGNCDYLPVGSRLTLPENNAVDPAPQVQTETETASGMEAVPAEGAEQTGDNLLRAASDLTNAANWSRVNGLSVSALQDGSFELTTSGATDPSLRQNVSLDVAGHSYRLTGEAKAGNVSGAAPILRVFGYALAADGSPAGATIKTVDLPLTDGFSPFSLDISIPADFLGSEGLVFRLDPGDGEPNGTNEPPMGYSVHVKNLSLVETK